MTYLWNWIQEKKQAGLVKHVGFSFHSTPEELNFDCSSGNGICADAN